MSRFDRLLACYRSGQISERQWQEHLKGKAFLAYVCQHLPAGVHA